MKNPNLSLFINKMKQKGLSPSSILQFQELYEQFTNHLPPKEDHKPVSIQEIDPYNLISKKQETLGLKALHKVIYVKINGGLGTSMGCTGPKATIPIKGKKTFLDYILKDINQSRKKYRIPLPLVLMNSFYTHTQTETALLKQKKIFSFIQNEFPRIDAKTLKPFSNPEKPEQEWYPPGHGNFLPCFLESGLLDTFIDQGFEYLFISNVDNLFATLCPKILGHMIDKNLSFLMETTPRTNQDSKGGALTKYQHKLCLLEKSQVHPHTLKNFENIKKFPLFNTNNIWIHLKSIKTTLAKHPQIPLIINQKRDETGNPFIQLETALGSYLNIFENSGCIVVPRSRFFPVKKNADLLLLQSDIVKESPSGLSLTVDTLPIISLSKDYDDISRYHHFIQKIPSLKNLKTLSINGAICIRENVEFKGTVHINVAENQLLILKNKSFENQTISLTNKKELKIKKI